MTFFIIGLPRRGVARSLAPLTTVAADLAAVMADDPAVADREPDAIGVGCL
jgi:hypothetical protein